MSISRPISSPISRSISRPISRSGRFGVGALPLIIFDPADYPAGLIIDASDQSKFIRIGRTVTSVLDSSGNGRTMGVIGTPQYYPEDNAIHLAPGQALFRADDGFFKSGKGAVFVIFTLRTADNQVKPLFAKYQSTGNQCTLQVGLSSDNRPQVRASTTGAPNSGFQLFETIPVNEPSYIAYFTNPTAEQSQFILNGDRNTLTTGTIPLLFDSNAGYGVNFTGASAAQGDIYLHYLMVYDDETIDATAREKIDGYLANWYDDHMLYREPISITAPTITGTPNNGYVLTHTPGLALRNPLYTYQWTRDGVAILGATKQTYLQTASDVGAVIGCRGKMYNEDGAVEYTITGTSCGAAFGTPPDATAPVITVAATLSGTGIHRQTMTCTPATIAVAHAVERTYKWFVGGLEMFGAFLPTYVVELNDAGKPIYCVESITNVYGTSMSTTNAIQSWIPPEDDVGLWYDLSDYWSIRDNVRNDGDKQYLAQIRNKGTDYVKLNQTTAANQPSFTHFGMNLIMPTATFDGVDDFVSLETEQNLVDKTLIFVMTSGREITGYNLDEDGNPDPSSPIYGAPLAGTIFSHSANNIAIRVTTAGAIQITATPNNWGGTVSYTLPDEIDANGATVPGISLPHVYTLTFGTTIKLYVDGDLKVASATRSGTTATYIDQIGVKNASTEFWTGNLSEFLLHPTIVSDLDRERYEGHLAYKYGISAKLPVAHTFKAAPPVVVQGLDFSFADNSQYLVLL